MLGLSSILAFLLGLTRGYRNPLPPRLCIFHFFTWMHLLFLLKIACCSSTIRRNKYAWNWCRAFSSSGPHSNLSGSESLKEKEWVRPYLMCGMFCVPNRLKKCCVFLVAEEVSSYDSLITLEVIYWQNQNHQTLKSFINWQAFEFPWCLSATFWSVSATGTHHFHSLSPMSMLFWAERASVTFSWTLRCSRSPKPHYDRVCKT